MNFKIHTIDGHNTLFGSRMFEAITLYWISSYKNATILIKQFHKYFQENSRFKLSIFVEYFLDGFVEKYLQKV